MPFEDILPLLLLNNQRDLLPLLLLLGERGESSRSESCSSDDYPVPSSFNAYLASLVGDVVRVSVSNAVDNALTLVGNLAEVGTDFIVLRDATAAGVPLGLKDRVIIPISNVVGIDRVPFLEGILPLLLRFRS
ncbi:MAG: hypothetical protein C7B44_03030 [Sulfobacillus thermosulfidooxidans]|uniref:Uncharacterized protein n=2 Tax=Clostridiales Family XVII. Incertae Sedis TaxID=539000 RepID=A0ABM6RVR1_9FIRM|nr:hypothetical protein BXT84_01720 [Sulfobacillus thermotolerans]POB10035.1 hypothetical protein CO251_12235 [Sulfobacillus sp. hq2]PSR37591.1 MAG: hypothetical protein C7B44_03030 [Sulfobacillus thermosulfidooxidans]